MKICRKMLACLIGVLLGCTGTLQPASGESTVQALFINVGKADAILLMVDEQRYLVDTGAKQSYDQLEQVLAIYQVSRLDGVIITHTDQDHVGGLKKLLKSDIEVARIYAGALYSDASLEDHPVYEAAEKNGMEITWLRAGDQIEAGKSMLQVLGPLTLDQEDENNNSLVMDWQTPEGNVLLTGDMELTEENELLEKGLIPQAVVLKVAHHGGADATGGALVQAVQPQWSIISTSSEERPSTPDEGVLARLWEAHSGVAITQDADIGILITLRAGNATAEEINLK
ncbi:MAG: MBL fold metallo-hydrolase [Eubacteriales bacterium]|nr:MBL fold metallo-hydrolase [Eubacteriales bacterium]